MCIGNDPSSRWLRFVDHNYTFGPDVIEKYIKSLPHSSQVLDIGAGSGRDLDIVKKLHPGADVHALECNVNDIVLFKQRGIPTYALDVEKDLLPFKDETLDIVICNQILEHTKELFWIVHEISRVLQVGGHLIVGVPNVASFHNRIGLLFGKHPTQAKSCSAHIRCFSKYDFLLFLKECFPNGYVLKEFDGSQFYPFPGFLAKRLSTLLPTFSVSIFFLLQKTRKYEREFLEYPVRARLATNFKTSHASEK